MVTSIGVIQFIPEPQPVLEAERRALRPGGRLLIWVHSREGLGLYACASRVLPLPLRDYVTGHLAHLDRATRKLTIYDQMNPSNTHLYRGAEIEALVRSAGFEDVRLHHRHSYSWTVLATRPDSP